LFPWLVAGPLVFLLTLSGGAIVLKALGLYRRRNEKNNSRQRQKIISSHQRQRPKLS
jgi:CDP-diacylglycerol--glycerol-3-phosphate 3-phosphatidyltransferase/cardiolipin synthase